MSLRVSPGHPIASMMTFGRTTHRARSRSTRTASSVRFTAAFRTSQPVFFRGSRCRRIAGNMPPRRQHGTSSGKHPDDARCGPEQSNEGQPLEEPPLRLRVAVVDRRFDPPVAMQRQHHPQAPNNTIPSRSARCSSRVRADANAQCARSRTDIDSNDSS